MGTDEPVSVTRMIECPRCGRTSTTMIDYERSADQVKRLRCCRHCRTRFITVETVMADEVIRPTRAERQRWGRIPLAQRWFELSLGGHGRDSDYDPA